MTNLSLDRGIYPVVPTPLLENQTIDYSGLQACIDFYLANDITGLTILGSGGELPYFTDQEQQDICQFVRQHCPPSCQLIVGVNAYSVEQAQQKIAAVGNSADAVLLLLPDYYPTDFENYLTALETIAESSVLPIVFYYFPQITKRFLTATQLSQILSLDNIIGIKDSSLQLGVAKKVLSRCPQSQYFTGLSVLLEQVIAMGGQGAICPIAAIIPKQTTDYFTILTAQANGNKSRLYQQIKAAMPLANNLEISANIQVFVVKLAARLPFPILKKVNSAHSATKQALASLGVPISSHVRSPLRQITNKESKQIHHLIKNLTSS